jgi:hypothetical protein
MKIGNSSIDSLIQGGTGSVNGVDSGGSSAASARAGGGSDSVRLSNASNLVALAKATSTDSSAARVQSLSSLIQAGQYQADSFQTSQAVVDGHLQA